MPAITHRGILASCLAITMASSAPAPTIAQSLLDAFSAVSARSAKTVDHSTWDDLLRRHVRPHADGINRVDYVAFKQSGHAALKAYLTSLEATDVTMLDRPEQMTFWINLYNAKTADIVLAHYPVKSIREISLKDADGVAGDGPWRAKVATVRGRALSLDEIENEILRPIFKDPRVHYALNCLSLGCPNLLAEAFAAARLESQLDLAATAFVNHPRGIDIVAGSAKASSIYEWFVDDFGGPKGVLAHLARYAEPGLKAKLAAITSIGSYDYDWTLNDLAR